jgi:hypothetical protein
MSHLDGCLCYDCVWRREQALQIAAWAIAWELEGLS